MRRRLARVSIASALRCLLAAAIGLCRQGRRAPDGNATAARAGNKGDEQAAAAKAGVTKAAYGKTKEGTAVDVYTLTNANGLVAKITNYGGTITELHVPDKNGKLADVALGFKDLQAYLKGNPFFGGSSAATATASPRASSRSTARPTPSRPTTAPTTSTAAASGSTRRSGPPGPSTARTAPPCASRSRAPTATRGTPASST